MTYRHICGMLLCMRTTIDIDDRLLAMAKHRAVENGTTLKKVVEQALRQALIRKGEDRPAFRLRWRTVKGRYNPAREIKDRDVIYEHMEGRW